MFVLGAAGFLLSPTLSFFSLRFRDDGWLSPALPSFSLSFLKRSCQLEFPLSNLSLKNNNKNRTFLFQTSGDFHRGHQAGRVSQAAQHE
jgi:hypothetical protein